MCRMSWRAGIPEDSAEQGGNAVTISSETRNLSTVAPSNQPTQRSPPPPPTLVPPSSLPPYDDFPSSLLEVRTSIVSGRGVYLQGGQKLSRGARYRSFTGL